MDISILNNFHGREEALRKITRYSMYSPMFYRTNLHTHSQRVMWIVQDLLPLAKKATPSINSEKALLLALVHDDAEIITGDIQLGRKLYMTQKQLDKLEENEKKAIVKLSSKYPKTINGLSYKDLLHESLIKGKPEASIEAQLMNYADRCDALGEALHEIHAGNKEFCTDKNEFEKGINPINVYIKILTNFPNKFPALSVLFNQNHPLLTNLDKINEHKILKNKNPHTLQSIKEKTSCPFYNHWRGILLKNGGEQELHNLTHQKEKDN